MNVNIPNKGRRHMRDVGESVTYNQTKGNKRPVAEARERLAGTNVSSRLANRSF